MMESGKNMKEFPPKHYSSKSYQEHVGRVDG